MGEFCTIAPAFSAVVYVNIANACRISATWRMNVEKSFLKQQFAVGITFITLKISLNQWPTCDLRAFDIIAETYGSYMNYYAAALEAN